MTNAEELINEMPIVKVRGSVVRCTGVQGMGLGHPVQYLQLDKRHKHTPVTCPWCGMRYMKVDGHDDHHHHHHHHDDEEEDEDEQK